MSRRELHGRDARLLWHAERCRRAERAMAAAATEDDCEHICLSVWHPAYMEICRLPARTQVGLSVKLAALLDEHENGLTDGSDTLRTTIHAALWRYLTPMAHRWRTRSLSH